MKESVLSGSETYGQDYTLSTVIILYIIYTYDFICALLWFQYLKLPVLEEKRIITVCWSLFRSQDRNVTQCHILSLWYFQTTGKFLIKVAINAHTGKQQF